MDAVLLFSRSLPDRGKVIARRMPAAERLFALLYAREEKLWYGLMRSDELAKTLHRERLKRGVNLHAEAASSVAWPIGWQKFWRQIRVLLGEIPPRVHNLCADNHCLSRPNLTRPHAFEQRLKQVARTISRQHVAIQVQQESCLRSHFVQAYLRWLHPTGLGDCAGSHADRGTAHRQISSWLGRRQHRLADLADFLLKQATDDTYLRTLPMVSE